MPFIVNSNKLVAGLSVKSYTWELEMLVTPLYAISRQQN